MVVGKGKRLEWMMRSDVMWSERRCLGSDDETCEYFVAFTKACPNSLRSAVDLFCFMFLCFVSQRAILDS